MTMVEAENTPLNRNQILARYPWLVANDEPHLVVMGDDLDAALSAALYLHLHPYARLVGIYHRYTTVYHGTEFDWPEVLDALWLDLDIAHPRCRSLGHHIVRLAPDDPLPHFAASCNLNELVGRSVEQDFRRKYPLGTIHFLMWLYGELVPTLPNADLLIWLADSAYINAQSKAWKRKWGEGEEPLWELRPGYRWNVREWLYEIMPYPPLQRCFEVVEEPAWEARMARFQKEVLEGARFEQGPGQAASQHLRLSGWQCQPPEEVELGAYMRRLLAFVAQRTGWHLRPAQIAPLKELRARSGTRKRVPVARVREAGLTAFLNRYQVFSYVFQSLKTLNYTTAL
jgi:hypothetical protein